MPPITIAEISFAGLSNAIERWVLKRELSKAPPIPMILFFGNPADFRAKYVIVSIGLDTTTIIASGENSKTFWVTVLTIPAFLLIPHESFLVFLD
jgi:hypothetical protein